MSQIFRILKQKCLRRRKFLLTIVYLYAFSFIIFLGHEKILNTVDMFIMPRQEEMCKNLPFNLTTNNKINLKNMTLIQVEEELKNMNILEGGKFLPASLALNNSSISSSSSDRLKVAIIIPYRDRQANLHLFLLYMHQFLSRQNIYYGIYLVEPLQKLKFNRAMLINIGYVESLKDDDWNCFIFHDVDLLPENEKNFYKCDKQYPKQMAIAVNINSYSDSEFFRDRYFGGVNAFTKEQFALINGFSNSYFNWGIEDDDARLRVLNKFPNMTRLTPQVGRYFANCHQVQERNPDRFLLYIGASSRLSTDGLNSVKYKKIKTVKSPLYTRFYISYNDKQVSY